ncbi:hypothetical protein, partial [Rhizobium ruizarguesonis]|uniref:hypothetical protein n=1 Tax=Rhizobium ruizarguesonis TaxID=2081791 RepID=UPI001954D4F1
RQNQPWREPIHPSSPPPKHYRQKNPIRKNKTRRKIDGFVSGLKRAVPAFFCFADAPDWTAIAFSIQAVCCYCIIP